MWSDLRSVRDENSIDKLVREEMKHTESGTTTTIKPKEVSPMTKRPSSPPPLRREDEKTASSQVESAKQETAAKESKVREALKEHQQRVREEARRLARVEAELQKLNAREQADVGILRTELEDIDRRLFYLERDYKQKEAAYQKAKEAFESLEGKKRSMREHLALMVLSSEKRKEDKLNELMAKMDER
mmetsp:Transcript_22779/g.73277  ORF Transcript_22779/g.73277 Transcript_22779/m.73277 type:complete len:188 (-) Transcript_22779:562-1125(-)